MGAEIEIVLKFKNDTRALAFADELRIHAENLEERDRAWRAAGADAKMYKPIIRILHKARDEALEQIVEQT